MRQLLFCSVLILAFSCSSKIISIRTFDGKVFQSKKNHAYGGQNTFVFHGNEFTFHAAGPSVFVSKGTWRYNSDKAEISLITNNDLNTVVGNSIDTLWRDLSGKYITVKSPKEIEFEYIRYYQQ